MPDYNYFAMQLRAQIRNTFFPGAIFLEFSTILSSPPTELACAKWNVKTLRAEQAKTRSMKGLIHSACFHRERARASSLIDLVCAGTSLHLRKRGKEVCRFFTRPHLDEANAQGGARGRWRGGDTRFLRKVISILSSSEMSADGRRSRMTSEFNLRASGSRGVLKRHRASKWTRNIRRID